MPRAQYLIDEITSDCEQGSRLQQLETALTRRGDEGWNFVTMTAPEQQTEKTLSGVRRIRSADLLLVFKRLKQPHASKQHRP
jgi:hypothetical protein